ncbi:MAG: GEVED domain-containing protein [Bacteroidota bacterium]
MRKVLFFLSAFLLCSLVYGQTNVYHENFEQPSGADSVTSSGVPVPWAINTRLFGGGAQCDTNYVQINDTSYLTTSAFNCTGYSNVILKFNHICKTEIADGGEVQISINNGPWFKLTGSEYLNPGNSQFVTSGNKFNGNTYPIDWQSTNTIAKPTQSWWRPEQFDISAYAGNQGNVRIRFMLFDANGNGNNGARGWYLDDIKVVGALSELIPPTITLKAPIVTDTVFNTGPWDVYAWIKDPSGIDTAYLVYNVNGGANSSVPMNWISDSTYKGTIPQQTWNRLINYHVVAIDNSLSHNLGTGVTRWFYTKKPPTTVTIGTGTSSYYYYGPIYRSSAASSYDYSQYWYLITASELAAAGLPNGAPITGVEWYKTDAYATTGNATMSIYMKNSAATALAASPWSTLTTGATQVYNTTTQTIPATIGWLPFTTSAYTYTGGGLEIGTNWDISMVAGNPTTGAFNWQYGSYSAAYTIGSANSVAITGNLSSTYGGNLRPNIKIHYQVTQGNDDASLSQITAPTGSQLANVNLPVSVIVKNYGTDTLKKTTIQWKVDGVAQTPYVWTGAVLDGLSTLPFTIGNANVPAGSHTLKIWTTLPNDSLDHNHGNDTATGVFYACDTLMHGNYTIGTGGNFATFADALISLNNCGINGPTVFNILAGTYNEQITFNTINGGSLTNTVTFKPASGATVVITNNSATATLKFNGTDNVFFDGSNNGTTTRNMSILNTSTASGTAAVWLASTGVGAGCTNVIIKNCILATGDNASGKYAVSVSGTSIGSSGDDNDNITIQNNDISKAYVGIYAYGTSSGLLNNLNILKNSLGSSTATSYLGHDGIMVSYITASTISGNTVYNIIGTPTTPVGITIGTGVDNSVISGNIIHDIQYTGTSGYGGRGIYCNTGSAASNLTFDNNMISAIKGDGYSSFSNSSPVGMYFDGTTGGLNIWNNSVYMNGSLSYNSASLTTAILFYSTANTGIDLRDNIFMNTMNNPSNSGAKNYAIYSTAPVSSFTSIDFNDYYVSGVQGVLGYFAAADQTSLGAWQAATSQDAQSISADPAFTSLTDLHTFSNLINNLGTPIGAVTTDIDGQPRDPSNPDMGADEFTPLADDLGIIAVLAPVSGCNYGNENVTIRIKNNGGTTITSADLYYKLGTNTPVMETYSGTLLPDSVYDFTFAQQANLTVPGNYTFKFYGFLNNDQNQLNDTISNYTIYSGYNFNYGGYAMGFEPTDDMTGWLNLDVNSDGEKWIAPYNGTAHTGSYSAEYYNTMTAAGDEWLFSRCFTLAAGSTYKVDYWYRVSSANYPESVDLKIGNAQTPGGMNTTLISMPSMTNTSYQKATATFTVPSDGSYYFGWHAYTPSGSNTYYYAYIDDINIALVPDQEAAALGVTTPNSGCGLTTTETVTMMIKNTGANVINGNLNAYYRINNSAPVSQPVTATIISGDTLTFTFSVPVDMHVTTADSIFNIKAWISLTGDPMQINDTATRQVISRYTPGVPIVTGDTIPYGGTATLLAASPANIYWYTNPTGGTSIHTGSPYVTPALYTTTIYHVEAATSVPGQHSIIGNGTSTQNLVPSYGLYDYSWSGMLYTAAEIAHAGSIDTVGFYVSGSTNYSMLNQKVYMAHTTDVAFTNADKPNPATMTQVYNGPITWLGPGLFKLPLQTPFSYNGADNLVIYWENNDGSWTSGYPSFYSSTTTSDMAKYDYQDGSLPTIPGTLTTERPNIYLGITVNGCASARVPDTAKVILMNDEAGIVSLTNPVSGCSYGNESVTIRIRNNGTNTINGNLNASYKVNGTAIATEPVTNTIIPGDTLTFTFTTTFNPGLLPSNQDSTYNIKAYIALVNDVFSSNDTINASVDLLYTPNPPTTVNATIPYGTSGVATAISPDSINWYTQMTGSTPIAQGHAYTSPILYGTTVYWAEAVSSGGGSLKITELNLGSTDSIEIQNTGSGTVDATGWVVAVSDDYSDINLVNANLWNLGTFTGNEVKWRCDDGSSPNYWGSNLYWSPGSGGWAMILDNNGVIVDYVAWSWNASDIQNFTATINSFPVTVGTEWTGDGVTSSSDYLNRIVSDNNNAADWTNTSNGNIGQPNTGLTFSGGSGCASTRVPDTIFVTGIPSCDVAVEAIYTPNSGIELTATEPVTIKVKNYGTANQTNIPVHYTVNGGTPVNEVIATLSAGDTIDYTFTQTANLFAYQSYTIKAYTSLNCDVTLVNDTMQKIVVNSPIPYCPSYAVYTADDDIGNVTFATLNNGNPLPTLSNPDAIHTYTDYTNVPPAQVIAGGTFTISISQIEDDNNWYDCLANVYIDYNRNGVFDVPAELVFSSQTGIDPSFPTVSGPVTIPTTGIVYGLPTRMRVVLDESDVAPPCGTYLWGETEDYFIVISPQIPHDAGVTQIVRPAATEIEGASIPVKVIVKNYGLDSIFASSNMQVRYQYNGQAPLGITYAGPTIPPNGTDTVTLPNLTVGVLTNNICAWTVLAGDSNTMNDTTCKSFYGQPNKDAGVTAFLQPAGTSFAGAAVSVEVVFKNFGTNPINTMSLGYKLNGVVAATQTWNGTLAPGAIDTLLFTQTYIAPQATYAICAYTSLTGDAIHSNDTLCTNPYGLFTSQIPYYDNFDGPVVNWMQTSGDTITEWQLGTPSYGLTNSAHSAPNAWDINLSVAPGNYALDTLWTQYFDFSNATSAKLKFWQNYYVENNYDGLWIEYSVDSSQTWQQLGVQNDTLGVNWYTNASIDFTGIPGWSNNSGGWIKSEYKLSILDSLASVRFRFVFSNDGSSPYDGYSIDDFSITIPSPIDAGVEQILSPSTQVQAGTFHVVKVMIRNYGLDTLYSIPVSYEVNGGVAGNATWTGTLPPNDTASYTFVTQFTAPSGNFSLCAYTGLVADGDHLNDTTCNNIMGVATFVVPYADNFEGTNYFFGNGGNNLWEHGAPASSTINAAHSPANCWKTNLDGDYTNNALDYLYTPNFLFTAVDSAYLEFWHWVNTENNYDGGSVQYSINGGSTWITLGYQGDPAGTGWYNATVNGRPSWTGNTGGWAFAKFNLGTIPTIVNSAQPVQFRFLFFSNASTSNYNGWAIDDFEIFAPPIAKDAGVIEVMAPTGATQTGSQVAVKVRIKNFGTDSLHTIPVAYAVNGVQHAIATWTGVLNPGDTTHYTFTTTYASPGSVYTLCGYTKRVGDTYWFNDSTCVSRNVTAASNDVGVSAILSPGAQTISGDSVAVTVRIKNYGTTLQTTFPVGYKRNGVQLAAEVWSGSLAGGDSTTYTFHQKYISPLSNYVLCGYTMMTGDANPANDQTCFTPTGVIGIDVYDANLLELWQNIPNPANDLTTIYYNLPTSGMTKFVIVDILGREVYRAEHNEATGLHSVGIDTKKLQSGVYFYSLGFNGTLLTKRMVITR